MDKHKKRNHFKPARMLAQGDEQKHRYCDPGQCHCCEDRGGGNFFCRYLKKTVVRDWHNTEDHLLCKRKK